MIKESDWDPIDVNETKIKRNGEENLIFIS